MAVERAGEVASSDRWMRSGRPIDPVSVLAVSESPIGGQGYTDREGSTNGWPARDSLKLVEVSSQKALERLHTIPEAVWFFG